MEDNKESVHCFVTAGAVDDWFGIVGQEREAHGSESRSGTARRKLLL
jgi:hypothetical protein